MNWTDLLSRVLPHVPGCPEPLAEDMIKDAAIAFCRESHAWEEQLASLYPVQGLLRYQLEVPADSEVISLASAKQAVENSTHKTDLYPDVNIFGLLRFETAPDPDRGPIEIRVILQPSRTAAGMPDRLGFHYDRALIHGALKRLFELPGKDWSAPQLAAYHRGEFDDSVTEARVRRARGNTERPIRVAPQPFI